MSSNERLADNLNFRAVLPEVTVYVYDMNSSARGTVEAAWRRG